MREGGNSTRPAREERSYDHGRTHYENESNSENGSDSEIEFPVVRAPVRRPALGEFFSEQKDRHALFDLSDNEEEDECGSEDSEVVISSPEHFVVSVEKARNKNQYAPFSDPEQELEPNAEQSTRLARTTKANSAVHANSSQNTNTALALARAAHEMEDIRRGVTGYEMLRAPVDATVPRLPKAQIKAVLNAELEERMMPIVLKHLPSFSTAAKRNDVWEQIARDSRGRYYNGNGARRHLIYLTKVLDDPTHVEHHKITPKLKEMLLTFQKNGFQGSKRLRKLKRIHEASELEQGQEQSAFHAQHDQEQFSAQHRAGRDQGPITRKSSPPPPALSREEWLSVRSEMDEPLVRMLLQIRPFDFCAYKQRPHKWKEVITALNHPRIPNSTIGSKRVRWLLGVFHNPSHAEYPKMSPALRELLTEYKDAVAKSEFTITSASPSPSSATTKSCGTTLLVDKDRALDTIDKAQEKADSAAESVEPFTTSAAYRDQVLLLEILRLRPFHMKRAGERIPMWDCVARNVRRQIGSTPPTAATEAMFATGEACMYRMKKLLSAVRNPLGKSSVTVPREQLKILKLLDKVVRFPPRRTTMEQAEIDVYVALDKEIETLLAKYPQRNATTTKPPIATLLKTPVAMETESRKKKDCHREETLGEDVADTRQSRERNHKRRREATPRSSTLEEIHALQAQVAQLFESMATGDAAVSKQISCLQGDVAVSHAQLTMQGSKLARERRAHREELLAMFELLKSEHETRERESEEVLQRIRKERRQRKREFAAMLERVKASILPPLWESRNL